MFNSAHSARAKQRVGPGNSVEVLLLDSPFNSSRWRVDPGTENYKRLLGKEKGSATQMTVGDQEITGKIVTIGDRRKHVPEISQAVERLRSLQ